VAEIILFSISSDMTQYYRSFRPLKSYKIGSGWVGSRVSC